MLQITETHSLIAEVKTESSPGRPLSCQEQWVQVLTPTLTVPVLSQGFLLPTPTIIHAQDYMQGAKLCMQFISSFLSFHFVFAIYKLLFVALPPFPLYNSHPVVCGLIQALKVLGSMSVKPPAAYLIHILSVALAPYAGSVPRTPAAQP